jgi:xanthine dehydrogenase accessory factor
MQTPSTNLLALLDSATPAIWVCVSGTKGSVPRERGAMMIVTAQQTFGTIGGGHLELKSIEVAREMLALDTETATRRHFPLGPALGQCCGGAVDVVLMPVCEPDRAMLLHLQVIEQQGGRFVVERMLDTGAQLVLPLDFAPWPIWVFGAGHVGQAIVQVLATLPCEVRWIDGRDAVFPQHLPTNVRVVEADDPTAKVRTIPADADVLVLTHSHALDLDICLELIRRDDLAYIGLIGSETKAATFRKRFEQRGYSGAAIARINCPIGRPLLSAGLSTELDNKHPGLIAVAVAADLIERRQILHGETNERGRINAAT